MWQYINPRYYFREQSWYLPLSDRVKLEPRSWRERVGYSESYVRQMKDAGRGHLL